MFFLKGYAMRGATNALIASGSKYGITASLSVFESVLFNTSEKWIIPGMYKTTKPANYAKNKRSNLLLLLALPATKPLIKAAKR